MMGKLLRKEIRRKPIPDKPKDIVIVEIDELFTYYKKDHTSVCQDLGSIEDHKEFIRAVNDASDEYQDFQEKYVQNQLQGRHAESQLGQLGTKEQLP
ncbi:hypothetical protein PsorP6_013749 [Peronosclerospora sorghi]|uniref:Uncharacterized protein n=1 Tax=Peronosclerospora sorghi TaxID=230839 RepID=A0ACC0VGS9_9STRA|nr:hypothetical protein PsorP6_013749 [Peronosclerospora sorghi]